MLPLAAATGQVAPALILAAALCTCGLPLAYWSADRVWTNRERGRPHEQSGHRAFYRMSLLMLSTGAALLGIAMMAWSR
jgi:hypothetical protein